MNTDFLDLEDALQIHEHQIEVYGGSHGVRDLGLLQSALAMPKAMFGGQYLHEDLFEMASAYLYHIVQNHPFIDGNKRAGLAVALTFLKSNGVTLAVGHNELTEFVYAVARGEVDKAVIAEFLRNNTDGR